MRYNVTCPQVCVTDISQCPSALMPDVCPLGWYYCRDGACRTGDSAQLACSKATSTCSCSKGFTDNIKLSSSLELYPCKVGYTVNVPNYAQNDHIGISPVIKKCQASLNISESVTSAKAFVLECKLSTNESFTTTDPQYLLIYIVIAFELMILLLYKLYRSKKNTEFEKNHPEKLFHKQPSGLSINVDNQQNQSSSINEPSKLNNMRMTGYKHDINGTITFFSIILMSAFWTLCFCVLIADYNRITAIKSTISERAHISDNLEVISQIFIMVWHLVAVWYLYLQMNSTELQTYFMVRATLEKADYIKVEKKIQIQEVLNGMDRFTAYILSFEKYFYSSLDISTSIRRVKKINDRLYIEFECVRYVYNQKTDSFEAQEWPVGPTRNDIHARGKGLTTTEANLRQDLTGLNAIPFKPDTFWQGFKKEFTGIFYIYQFMQIVIWYFYSYYVMALVINAVVLISGFTKIYVSRKAQIQILQVAKFDGKYTVLRDGCWKELDSKDLVPGDIFELKNVKDPVPVDCILITGGVVVDESSLTGEALPVGKYPLDKDSEVFDLNDNNHRNMVFAGCNLLEINAIDNKVPVKAYVVSIGALTAKGTMVRDMLYPLPFKFIFTEQLKVVALGLIIWGVILLFVAIGILNANGNDGWFFGMVSISQILSPLLPTVLVIGQNISAERLRKKDIYCMDMNRITLAGKIKFFCFDKTGTLTKGGLDYVGTQEVDNSNQFLNVKSQFDTFGDVMKRTLLTCHSLTTVGERFVGNFVDVEMFRVTGGNLTNGDGNLSDGGLTSTVFSDPSSGIPPLRVIKRFEFSHKFAYMSVIVRDASTGNIVIYLKGSFEKIKQIVDHSTLPANYEAILKNHTTKGLYVIAVACCKLPPGTSTEVAIRWPRELLEKDAVFSGLILFRNEVKPDTLQSINEIRKGGCRTVMVTGDNINTAIYIGWSSGMIRKDWQKQDPLIITGDVTPSGEDVVWRNSEEEIIEKSSLETLIQKGHRGFRQVEIAITGNAFRKLVKDGWLQSHILDVRIFSSMKPLDKIACIRLHMEKGITAMCGDGGNDAGALKAAHAGIALSDADSSVIGHFSSKNKSLTACVDLLKESRCSLDVTFASYKYLIMYGEVLAFVGLVQYLFKVNMSQAMCIMIDASTVPLSWALSLAKPTKRLLETRPTAQLLGYETILSILGQLVINILFMIISLVVLSNQSFFKCHAFDSSNVNLGRWWELADNYESSVTSLLMLFQIFHAAATFNLGWKYRQGFVRNVKFCIIYALLLFLVGYVVLADPNPTGCLFRVNCGTKVALESLGYSMSFTPPEEYYSAFGHNVMPYSFRIILLGIAGANLIALLMWEGIVMQGWVRRWIVKRQKKTRMIK